MSNLKKYIFPVCLVLLVVLFHCFFLIYQVHGDSMDPTLKNNNFGLAVRTNVAKINRFDIVIIDYYGKNLVKRVIGLPGETIDYINNTLYVNGEVVEEDFVNAITYDFSVTLGENEYYCLGDNREHSSDSRVYGPFTKKQIKAVLIGG